MSALVKVESLQQPATLHFDEAQVQLLKNTICKGSTDEELKFFLMACQRTGLDPFAKQIYSVPRGGQRVIQTSVDGYRIIAERTGRYAPGREPTYAYDKNGQLFSATSYVQKQTKDGSWHEVACSAIMAEYDGKNNFWKKMPHLMLAKCAECLCLRKAFPAEMSGTYAEEEMHQAETTINVKPLDIERLSTSQVIELVTLFNQCSPEYQKTLNDFIQKKYNTIIFDDIPHDQYEKMKKPLLLKSEEYQKQLAEAEMNMNIKEVE
jgi:phage recombination protein Bet